MPSPEVIERMRQLRAALAETPPDAPHVAGITKHVDTVLVEPTHAPHYDGLKDRLTSASADLEVAHPGLAASLSAVINALTTAGV